MSYLPAEWHKQSLIQLTWPHKDTDWAYMLEEVNACFLKIAYEVLKRQNLLIVAPDPDSIRDSIDNYGADIQKLVTSKINTNDTWARDHAFIVGTTNRIQCYGTRNQKADTGRIDSGWRELPLCRQPVRTAMVG